MNEALQFGNHPDADLIGAFVEHALPAHEREKILAHLAVCPECREIVAASLPPMEEPPPVRPVPDLKPWWSGWRLAWPATALATALILIAVYFHRPVRTPQGPAGDQVAENRPETSSSLDQRKPPTTAAPAANKPAAAPDVTGHGTGARGALQPQNSNTALSPGDLSSAESSFANRSKAPIEQAAPASAAPEISTLKSQVRLGASSAGAMSGGMGAGSSIVQPPDAKTAPQDTASKPYAASALPNPYASAPNAAVAPSQTAEAAEVISSASALPLESANPNAPGVTPDRSVTLSEERITGIRHSLPSRLSVLSIAAEGSRVLAIDTSNSVFISQDDGMHWKRVPTPWQGRAVSAVRVNYPPTNPAVLSRENGLSSRSFSAGIAPQTGAMDGAVVSQKNLPAAATGASLIVTVTDITGAVISRADVTVTDIATQNSRAVQTDGDGRYRFDSITPASYRVDAYASGFVKQTRTVVVRDSAQPTVVDLKLNVGAANAAVTVQAADAGLETETTNLEASSTRLKERSLKKAKAAASTPGAAPAVFQITTDAGEHWSSADGLTWKRQ